MANEFKACPACRNIQLERQWCSVCNGSGAAQPEPACRVCGEAEPFTGTCGSGGDPRALCNTAKPEPVANRAIAQIIDAAAGIRYLCSNYSGSEPQIAQIDTEAMTIIDLGKEIEQAAPPASARGLDKDEIYQVAFEYGGDDTGTNYVLTVDQFADIIDRIERGEFDAEPGK